jgi:hypothetical protein
LLVVQTTAKDIFFLLLLLLLLLLADCPFGFAIRRLPLCLCVQLLVLFVALGGTAADLLQV